MESAPFKLGHFSYSYLKSIFSAIYRSKILLHELDVTFGYKKLIKMKKLLIITVTIFLTTFIYSQQVSDKLNAEIVKLNKFCESSANKSVFSVSDSDLLKRKSNNSYECEFRISDITELEKHDSGFYKDLLIHTDPEKISVIYKGKETKGKITVISFASETDRDEALDLLAKLSGIK